MKRILLKFLLHFTRYPIWVISPRLCTQYSTWLLQRLGARITGEPNYLSAKIWFDGGDYSQIHIAEGVTISSNVRLLTHDWAPYTAARAIHGPDIPIRGASGEIVIEEYAFVGTGAILLPGTRLGRGSVVGAGAVVKGAVASGAIVIGCPAKVVGTTDSYVAKYYGDF